MDDSRIELMTISDEEPLSNIDNYWIYSDIANGSDIKIDVQSITKENWKHHYDSVLNIFKDGIETDEVQKAFIIVHFTDNKDLDLSVPDYYLNLIMWNMLIHVDIAIESKHVFFDNEITKDSIKNYIDNFFIDTSRKKFSNKELNNIIDDAIHYFHDINEFAMYLSNTVNLEDNIFLMNKCKEFYDCMHADLSNVPLEDVKSVGMGYANKAIDIMKNSKKYLGYDHCLADACRASEGINPKQFKEFTINIGTKPDGHGGVFEKPIQNSFINGGVSNIIDYFIESSTGRTAQIIKYNNVGDSGHFARILGLNNMDSFLNRDSHYDCGTTNFVEIVIKDKKTLKMLNNRYYRLDPNGIEKLLTKRDENLIGKKIYLRSPITCASAARGHGICYKCYGDLAYTVYDSEIDFGINIGRLASENLSSSLTQKLLSAKHLLETFIEKVTWCNDFSTFFEIEDNVIKINSDLDLDNKDIKLIVDPDLIELVDEENDDLSSDEESDDDNKTAIYNEFITEFDILPSDFDEPIHINNDKNVKLYISNELNTAIRKAGYPIDSKIYISFNELTEIPLFIIAIENNELSKTLNYLNSLLNKKDVTKRLNIHELLQELIDTTIEGGLNIASTHLEVILSNQCRDADNILERAKWYEHNPNYEILTLDSALINNPSVTVSLSYQRIKKMLYNPITFKKNGSSFMDLFFMEKPQCFISSHDSSEEKEIDYNDGDIHDLMRFFEDPNKITAPLSTSDIDIDDDSLDNF